MTRSILIEQHQLGPRSYSMVDHFKKDCDEFYSFYDLKDLSDKNIDLILSTKFGKTIGSNCKVESAFKLINDDGINLNEEVKKLPLFNTDISDKVKYNVGTFVLLILMNPTTGWQRCCYRRKHMLEFLEILIDKGVKLEGITYLKVPVVLGTIYYPVC